MAAYFGRENKPVSFNELASQYRARSMMACLMNSRDVKGAEQILLTNAKRLLGMA